MARRDEEGMVTAFAAVFVMALLLFAGLVFDGGSILVNRREAIDHADSAARAGAQALDETRYRATGEMTLDQQNAKQAAQRYLQQAGERGQVSVADNHVQVTIDRDVPMRILGIGGFMSAHVSETGAANLERE